MAGPVRPGLPRRRRNATVIVFIDGDGADRGDLMALLVDPIRSGDYDFVIASRARGEREPGAMSWHQLVAGYLAGLGTRALYGVRYTDMCAYRAIRRDCLEALRHARDDLWLEHRDADAGGPAPGCAFSKCRCPIAGAAAANPRWPARCADRCGPRIGSR